MWFVWLFDAPWAEGGEHVLDPARELGAGERVPQVEHGGGLLHVGPGVRDDPGDQEAGEAGDEPLLGELPGTTVLRLVYTLRYKELLVNYCIIYKRHDVGQESSR